MIHVDIGSGAGLGERPEHGLAVRAALGAAWLQRDSKSTVACLFYRVSSTYTSGASTIRSGIPIASPIRTMERG